MVNLAINDYYDKRLVLKNGELKIVDSNFKVSSSATEGEEHRLSSMDAEMHPFPDHEQS